MERRLMKRAFGIFFAVGILAALSLPLANLALERPDRSVEMQLASIRDPYFKKAAPILQANCAHCHAQGTRRPFYAGFPIASGLIDKDIREGLARFNFGGRLQGEGKDFSEIELARLEHVLQDGSMPPLRYVALHWNAHLSQEESDALLVWLRHQRMALRNDLTVPRELAAEPVYPIPLQVQLNSDKVALGQRLFHDKRLSADNSISCASCHALNKGGTDQSQVSTGISGQKGGINAPTVYNAAYNFVQFWDGRAKDLLAQAHGPVQNPVEMGSTWPQVTAKLRQDSQYVQAFKRYYPDGITGDNIADAIVEFERSLITPNSRFDQYLRGNKDILSKDELAGYQLFKTHCASCHAGTNMGGLSYEKMGWRRPYFADHSKLHKDDFGRFNVTAVEADRHYFKVPTLRNVALTWPYFHNGSTSNLRKAVQVMAQHQVDKQLTDQELDQITAFLKTLTGEYQGYSLK
jgi:cytochrome c peroxidase